MTGPLAGIRVIEIASLAPAPFGCMLLADLGADVVRVDRISTGSPIGRAQGPLDRGRRTIAVDLKSPGGVAAVLELAAHADVLVEGFRPGVTERLGIGPDAVAEVNPRLIYARMTGWGQQGPLAQTAGHDINFIAVSGALEPLGRAGEKPHAPLNVLGDFAGGGAFLALGILAALYERNQSGRGQVVDAAMVDGSSILMAFLHGMREAGEWPGSRGMNLLDGAAAFYDTYETSDRHFMAVGSIEPQFYRELLRVLELDDLQNVPHLDEDSWPMLRVRFAEAFRARTRDEWTALFDGTEACVTPVLSTTEAPLHPHNAARNAFVDVGGAIQPAPAPRFSRTPPASPQPLDGGFRDPRQTLIGWGIDPADADRLISHGAVA